MTEIFAVFLDVAILVLLGATIFYSVRLSNGLKTFRDSRKELSSMLEKLSLSITRAEQAISGLGVTARESGRELQETINQARSLSEELQFINEAGDNLARRLENLAERGGSAKSPQNAAMHAEEEAYFSDPSLERIFRKPEAPKAVLKAGKERKEESAKAVSSPPNPFAIRDRDYDRGETPGEIPAEEFWPESGNDGQGLRTRAEKDLYAALMEKRRKKGK